MREEVTKPLPVFGREEIMSRLAQRLEGLKKGYRQNVAVVGPRHIGKTHLLREFLRTASRDPDLIPIYLSLTPTDFDGFVERWLGSLLQGFLASRGLAFPEEFQQLVKISRDYIPKTLERMREAKKHAFRKKHALAFRELLGLTATLGEETAKKILLILDELPSISTLDVGDPFGLFGKEVMIQKDTLYFATSSQPHRTKEIFHDRLSLLFGNFEVLEMGPVSWEAVRSWRDAAYPGWEVPDRDLRLLSLLFNNHPYYFDLFFEEARRTHLAEGAVSWSRELMLEALEAALFHDRGLLHRHFDSELLGLFRLHREPRPYVKALVAISNGRQKLLQISAYLGQKGPETKKGLQRLVAEGLLEKRGSFYRLPDPLFRFWLRNVLQAKERSLDPFGETARTYFRHRLREEIRMMEEEERKDLTARLESLFREFRNEGVEIGGKKLRCPAFLEIASRPTNGRFFPILGQTAQGRWFCQVFRDQVGEGDVSEFMRELKGSRRKIQRRLMVTLGGIDLNAKLMAHEARIQIWDLDDVNALLDLYGKLKVIP